jgi:hypothetical protein
MRFTSCPVARHRLVLVGLMAGLAAPAVTRQPTSAQADAIRHARRADYRALASRRCGLSPAPAAPAATAAHPGISASTTSTTSTIVERVLNLCKELGVSSQRSGSWARRTRIGLRPSMMRSGPMGR